MIPHSIRLRQPWDELPATAAGRRMFRRGFNKPTGLDDWERVSLEIDQAIFAGEVRLNGARLGELTPGQFFSAEITALLQPANALTVEVDLHSALPTPPPADSIYILDPNEPPGSPIGEVRLVIRAIHASDRG